MLTIDGSTLEGGGQLTRLALGLSAITSTPVHIHSIRAGRSAFGRKPRESSSTQRHQGQNRGSERTTRSSAGNRGDRRGDSGAAGGAPAGGLKDSHLAALRFLAEHCDASVEGDFVGSTDVVFRPSRTGRNGPRTRIEVPSSGGREFTIDLAKSGSVWLIFQAIFPFLVFCTDWRSPREAAEDTSLDKTSNGIEDDDGSITLVLKGGTNVSKAMSTEYMTQVFAPVAARIGLPKISIRSVSRGWAGNAPAIGEVHITIHRPATAKLSPTGQFIMPSFSLSNRGTITNIEVSIIADPPSTLSTLISTLASLLPVHFPTAEITTHLSEASGDQRRLYILLVARTSAGHVLGADFLGSGGRAKSAVELTRQLDEACVAAVAGLRRQIRRGGCVDEFLQDQVVVFQALGSRSWVDGTGQGEVAEEGDENEGIQGNARDEDGGDESGTLHTRTVRWVCESMLVKYRDRIAFGSGGKCRGINWNDEEDGMGPGADDLMSLGMKIGGLQVDE